MVDMLWVEYKVTMQIFLISKRGSFGFARDRANPLMKAWRAIGGRRSERRQFLCGFAAEADAIGNANAVVGVSGKPQAWEVRNARGDAGGSFLVADRVLSHGTAPSRDLCMFRF
jgi:hypothetical protein